MKKMARIVITWIVCVPIALLGTLILLPLWRWIEANTGIEAIGHSGPAEWCFVAVYAVLLTGIFIVRQLVHKKQIP